MTDVAKVLATIRARLSKLSTSQVRGINVVLAAADGLPLSYAAYMLATAWHETNKTMLPVVEAYWLSEDWRRQHLRYYPWHGRGYVQLTWEANYRKADKALSLGGSLVKNPDRAMEPEIAAQIMRRGMVEGWFTGVTLSNCLPTAGMAARAQYIHARTIINGRDKDDLIEDYAQVFERALRDGGWA